MLTQKGAICFGISVKKNVLIRDSDWNLGNFHKKRGFS